MPDLLARVHQRRRAVDRDLLAAAFECHRAPGAVRSRARHREPLQVQAVGDTRASAHTCSASSSMPSGPHAQA